MSNGAFPAPLELEAIPRWGQAATPIPWAAQTSAEESITIADQEGGRMVKAL
jgi:hypothetical protein